MDDQRRVVTGSVPVDYGQGYAFDVEAGCGDGGGAFESGTLWEQKAAPVDEAGIIVLTRKQHGDTRIEVHVLDDLPSELDAEADHLVELGLRCDSGRLRVTGWDTQGTGFEVGVPAGPLRLRVNWLGLARAVALEAAGDHDATANAESLRIDIAPGVADGVTVLCCWREWVPPEPASTTPSGRRLIAGSAAQPHREMLEPIALTFWTPYPEIFGGYVTSMLRDPATGARWAGGTRHGHPMLAELTVDEADALEAQGFFQGHTFARDDHGDIWSSDWLPIERAPCLNYIAPDHYALVRSLALPQQEIPLPDGWGRIYRRDQEGHLAGPIDAVEDGASYTYQRWRDAGPGPTMVTGVERRVP